MSGDLHDLGPRDRPGEYVLGVLRGQERREFEAERARSPALEAEVAAWEERLLPLAQAVPPAAPPPRLWRSIEMALSSGGRDVPVAASPSRFTLWRSLAFWRGFSLLAAAAAIILAILRPQPGPPPPDLVAILQTTPQARTASPAISPVAFTIAMRPDGAASVAPVSRRRPPQHRVWELWAIAPKAKPVPVGLMRVRHTTLFKPGQVPPSLRKPHVLLAVSVEPPGGSPTGQPTGPVMFTGPLLPLR
jgi:anti-sigma-K factor RskA